MVATLVKGQNAALTAHDVVVSVQVAAPAELSALLVTEQGKVRSDADFVFYNQPSGPGVRLQPGQPPSVAVSFVQVPAEIAQIRAVITLENAGSNFGQIAPPTAIVSDAAGNRLYEYQIADLSAESIVVAVELYRRQGSWKVRAVGQGYAGGFAALVTDHGVSVDDAPRTSMPAASPYPTQPPPAPLPPAAPPQSPVAPTQSPVAPPPPPFVPSRPPIAPPAASYPAAPPAPQSWATPPPPPAPHSSGEVSLSKDRPVSLAKGQRVTLRKDGGVALTAVRMGLGWDPVKKGFFGSRAVDIDLDAWVAMFAGRNLVDVAYYGQLTSKDGSIRHQGDNLVGGGQGDDEVIQVDLTRVSPRVDTLLFVVTSYQGHTFEQVRNAFCRLVDGTTGTELARFTLSGGMAFTALAMAKLYRADGDWKMQALGDGFQAKHPGEAVPQLGRWVVD
ncbi:MAG: stress protein [Nocardia sp.]|uniref:TerD family protein n=1 Tax=Nocardia sp. TaxID=1821 RepID=UPI00260F47AD|nr:TerD family protein [Nocardia sp.]MCU1639846.1 stress protein [Nocardia sp.]